MDGKLMESIMSEFEKSQDHTSELLRLQSDLSNCESELVALQIRFVHKNKENEELKRQLGLKSKDSIDKRAEIECNSVRLNSLEFHYNELLQKHKMCLDCLETQKLDYEKALTESDELHERNKKLEVEKVAIRESFRNQTEDMAMNIKRLADENDANIQLIKELKGNFYGKEVEIIKAQDEKFQLELNNKKLMDELQALKGQYSRNIGKKSIDICVYEENIKRLELDLAKMNSKFDQTYFELVEVKKKHDDQLKLNATLRDKLQHKDIQYKEFQSGFEKCFVENQNFEKLTANLQNELQQQFESFSFRVDSTSRQTEQERCQFKKQQELFESVVKKLTQLYNDQQKKFESVVLLSKNQSKLIDTLRSQAAEFIARFTRFKDTYYLLKSESREASAEMKFLQDKCCDLEARYAEKCEHLNNLEREVYMVRNSLETAVVDVKNFQNQVKIKEDELNDKIQIIQRLEAIINQQNKDLNKRKVEISERINQMDVFDSRLKEEKATLDMKMAHMEASLKSKSKQLHQRIEQIKEMSEMVETLKEEKDQKNYKLHQLENMLKCQKHEIESKSSLLKQFELRNQDTVNELKKYKQERRRSPEKKLLVEKAEKGTQMVPSARFCEKNVQTDIDKMDQKGFAKLNSSSFTLSGTIDTDSQTTMDLSSVDSQADRTMIDDLRLNLKIKENIIETVNDNLVLKEAEIARLKAKIGLFERNKKQDNNEIKNMV